MSRRRPMSRSPLPANGFDRTQVMRLAAEAQLDPRTIERAMANGIDSLRARVDRERIRWAADKLGIEIK